MSNDRPTFSEHWYRVSGLRPRLMPSVMVRKQFYRGQEWMLVTMLDVAGFLQMSWDSVKAIIKGQLLGRPGPGDNRTRRRCGPY